MTNSNSLIWSPVPGEQANGVAQRSKIDDLARAQVVNSAVQILGLGIDPNSGNNSRTGLVVGYVQSGKTLSFTTVIGLARDNGFPLVIVIAGNKDNLLRQSYERLERDLDVNGGVGLPKWKMAKNPSTKDGQSEQIIRQTITNWNDTSLDKDEKHTLLITVLK